MSEEKNEKRKQAIENISKNPNLLTGVWNTVRLVARLMSDKRVNIFLKILPVFSLVYLINPMDAFIPVIDDALVMGIGTYLFIEFCPPDVVEEHRRSLEGLESQGEAAKETSQVINSIFTESEKKDRSQE